MMPSVSEEEFTARFVVVKNSWKGHYTRGFAVSPRRVATLKPRSLLDVTNSWAFGQTFIDVVPEPKSRTQFTLVYSKNGKVETMSFDSPNEEERADLLTSVQRYRALFDRQYSSLISRNTFRAFKFNHHNTYAPIELCVTSCAIEEMSSSTPRRKLGEYLFTQIKGMTSIEGEPDTVVIVYGPLMKLHLYKLNQNNVNNSSGNNVVEQFIQTVNEYTFKFIGLPHFRAMNTLSQVQFQEDRLGIRRDALEAVAEFSVCKLSNRHLNTPEPRLLSSTHLAIVEREPLSYNVICVYPLRSVFGLVRYCNDEQRFDLILKEPPIVKKYCAPLRDALLAHLLDACREAGNTVVHILPRPIERGRRWNEWRRPVSEEVESGLLSCLVNPERDESSKRLEYVEMVRYFNANIDYSGLRWCENKDGLFVENRERLIYSAIHALLTRLHAELQNIITTSNSHNKFNKNIITATNSDNTNMSMANTNQTTANTKVQSREIEEENTILQVAEYYNALRRLTVSRIGFSSIALIPPLIKMVHTCVILSLQLHHVTLTEAVIDFVNTLMAPHHNHYEVEHESINKNAILRFHNDHGNNVNNNVDTSTTTMLTTESFNSNSVVNILLKTLSSYIHRESAALVVQQVLQFLVYTLCPPFSESTEAGTFRRVMHVMVERVGKPMFQLLRHHCMAIRYAAGQLIRVVLEEGDARQFAFMQRAALTEGGFLMQFNVAVFSSYRPLRDLSRRLLAYWTYQNVIVQDLLRRMIPLTLLNFLQSSEEAPLDEQEEVRTKGVVAMTSSFRESKMGWFRRSFEPREVASAMTRNREDYLHKRMKEFVQQYNNNSIPATGNNSSKDNPVMSSIKPIVNTWNTEEKTIKNANASSTVNNSSSSKSDQVTVQTLNTINPTNTNNAINNNNNSNVVSTRTPNVCPSNSTDQSKENDLQTSQIINARSATVNSNIDTIESSSNADDVNDNRVWMRLREVRVQPSLNWNLFFYQIKRDHCRPDLIWNHTTRDELRRAVDAELELFIRGKDLAGSRHIAWNYNEFEIVYHSLDNELKIGRHYPRLLFDNDHLELDRPKEFFNDLYHRFLLSTDVKSKLQCLHGMSILYTHYANDIGQFNDLTELVHMFTDTDDPMVRDRLLLFWQSLLHARYNVQLFVNSEAMSVLASHVTLAQLHIDRPQMQVITNAIEYTSQLDNLQGQELEWHYVVYGVKSGPVSYTELKRMYANKEVDNNTKVWAQGLPGWKALRDVAQLKWGIANAHAVSLLTYTEVTCHILDIFLRLCSVYPSRCVDVDRGDYAVMQPLPKIKRFLSSPLVLPHLVQLLLTFDSSVCVRVHRLIFSLMQDNPLISRLYLTGYFYFALMYTASDIVPMCEVLELAHRAQAFQFAQSDHAIVRSSILGPLLPPAMICFLTHHGAHEFASIFLGEFETPETVWSPAMRRWLAGKVAAHVADFTPRLLGNNTLVYQYCPIGRVEYDQLRGEIFCSEYYLRHLCDELHFPDWPIRQPVQFLRDVLLAWRAELNKQPCVLTRESCLRELEIDDVTHVNNTINDCSVESPNTNTGKEEQHEYAQEGHGVQRMSRSPISVQQIRRAYFALAARYHPDKNSEGRERFEQIQDAYTFLISDDAHSSSPNRAHIALLLRTQSILFKRCGTVLQEYKYAGYDLLLQLIRNELEEQPTQSPEKEEEIEVNLNDKDRATFNAVKSRQTTTTTTTGTTTMRQMLRKPIVLIEPAVELCYYTVENVPLNADELQEEGGIPLLAQVSTQCFELITPLSRDNEVHVKVATHCLLTFAVSARFHDCRVKMANEPVIPYYTSRAVALEYCPALSRAGIQATETQCLHETLRSELLKAGVVWHLLRYLFHYDTTLHAEEEEHEQQEHSTTLQESHHAQLFANRAALFALRALYTLCGFVSFNAYEEQKEIVNSKDRKGIITSITPHAELIALLMRLLTPYIMHKIMANTSAMNESSTQRTKADEEILKLLNTNSATPYFIWNNTTRSEVQEFIESNSSICAKARMDAPENELPSLNCDSFHFSDHVHELVVGGIFLRVYVSQPNFTIDDPRAVYAALLTYLVNATKEQHLEHNSNYQQEQEEKLEEDKLHEINHEERESDEVTFSTTQTKKNDDTNATIASKQSVQSKKQKEEEKTEEEQESTQGKEIVKMPDVRLAASAWRVLVTTYTEEIHTLAACESNTERSLSLLAVKDKEVLENVLHVLGSLMSMEDCAVSLASSARSVCYIITVLHSFGKINDLVALMMSLLIQLLEYRAFVENGLRSGLYVLLLKIFATVQLESVKEDSCRCLVKMCSDKLVGRRVYLLCSSLLPSVILDTMNENVTMACQMLDTWQENPELIWNKAREEKLISALESYEGEIVKTIYAKSECDELHWELPTRTQNNTAMPTKSANCGDSNNNNNNNNNFDYANDEVVVDGVYIRIYLEQAGWAVRRPKEFLNALLEQFISESNNSCKQEQQKSDDINAIHDNNNKYKDSKEEDVTNNANVNDVEGTGTLMLIVQSGVRLLSCTPNLRDHVANLGYVTKLVQMIDAGNRYGAANTAVIHGVLYWLREMTFSSVCVEALTQVDFVRALLNVWDVYSAELPIVLEIFEHVLTNSTQQSSRVIVRYCVQHDLAGRLLETLESGAFAISPEMNITPSAFRALLIKVIKALANVEDAEYGSQIKEQLASNSMWRKYKDQSHDLFLADTQHGGYLTDILHNNNNNGPNNWSNSHVPLLTLTAATQVSIHDTEPPPLPPN